MATLVHIALPTEKAQTSLSLCSTLTFDLTANYMGE